MLEDKRAQAMTTAQDAMDQICRDFGKEFGEKVGNIDGETERDRIFILEDMLRDTQRRMNGSLLEYTKGLIESIDEKELIERKKGSI